MASGFVIPLTLNETPRILRYFSILGQISLYEVHMWSLLTLSVYLTFFEKFDVYGVFVKTKYLQDEKR